MVLFAQMAIVIVSLSCKHQQSVGWGGGEISNQKSLPISEGYAICRGFVGSTRYRYWFRIFGCALRVPSLCRR